MKPIFLLTVALICLMAKALPAQTDSLAHGTKSRQHELGMNLYVLSVQAGDFYSQYQRRVNNYVFNGIYYKYYYGKNALRGSFNYFQKLVGPQNRGKAVFP